MKSNLLSQLGRSMVEILGVLAVIGVLTIGSLFGYNYALKQQQINELIYNLEQVAIVASSQKDAGVPVSLIEFENEEFWEKYNISYEINDDEIYIELENISEDLLQLLIKRNWKLAHDIYIDDIPIDDYDFKTHTEKQSFLLIKQSLIKSAYALATWKRVGIAFKLPVLNEKDKEELDKEDEPKMCIASGGIWNGTSCDCPSGKVFCRSYGVRWCIPSANCTLGEKRCSNNILEVCVHGIGSTCPTTEWVTLTVCGPCEKCSDNECKQKDDYERCVCEGSGDINPFTGLPITTGKKLCSPGNCCDRGCCSDGTCKPETPGCCPEEIVDGCCPDDDDCCPSSCECGCDD